MSMEARIAEMYNPDLKERGYHNLITDVVERPSSISWLFPCMTGISDRQWSEKEQGSVLQPRLHAARVVSHSHEDPSHGA